MLNNVRNANLFATIFLVDALSFHLKKRTTLELNTEVQYERDYGAYSKVEFLIDKL